jgi:uncharacterized damage-inducible protein DinB
VIEVGYVRRMARYNQWQNQNLYDTGDHLSDAERRKERGAFFGSIQKSLSHLMWADQLWLSRFNGTERPPGDIASSATLYPDWQSLKQKRIGFDAEIVHWADGVAPAWLTGELAYYSYGAGRDVQGPRTLFVAHFFNHQTHHRGQVHCLLTQAGGRPGDTDLQLLPEWML